MKANAINPEHADCLLYGSCLSRFYIVSKYKCICYQRTNADVRLDDKSRNWQEN